MNTKFACSILLLLLCGINLIAQETNVGVNVGNRDCYSFLASENSNNIPDFTFTSKDTQYFVFGKVQKDYSPRKKKINLFSVHECPTGRSIRCNTESNGGNFILPSLVIAERQDSTLQIIYLLTLTFEGNVHKEVPLLKQVINFTKDSAVVLNKDTVFHQPVISSRYNAATVNRIKYMSELQKKMTGRNAEYTHNILFDYMNALLTCTLAGYPNAEELFLNLQYDRHTYR